MIERLTLENFQAHQETVLDFGAGVNVIVGPSDAGKSAIIRALGLLVFNRPAGTQFIRHGTKESRVSLVMDGTTVERVRGKSRNVYVVDGEEFKAPGRDVPPEVSQVLQFQEINFQGQHDAPFLLSETAGEVGRVLNGLVDLTVIDRTLSSLNSQKTETRRRAEYLEEETKKKREALRKWDGLEDAQEALQGLQDATLEAQGTQDNVLRLEALLGDLGALLVDLEDVPQNLDSLLEELSQVESQVREAQTTLETTKAQGKRLGTLLGSIETAQGDLLEFPDTLEEELRALQEEAENVSDEDDRASALEADLHDLGVLLEKVQFLDAQVQEAQENLEELIGDACPLCGRPTK